MGDVSAEPSMEDILSSIKRIIAEEGESAGGSARLRRGGPRPLPPVAPAPEPETPEEVLELDQRLDHPAPATAAPGPAFGPASPAATPPPAGQSERPESAVDPSISTATVQATRGALDALSRLVVKPEGGGDGTLEGLVRDMLRPMVSAWLDEHLPRMAEEMVAREIAKIMGPSAAR